LRKAVAQIEDHLGITDERERTLNEAKATVAELEKVVAAYTADGRCGPKEPLRRPREKLRAHRQRA
jgi:hypothetical protein